MNKLLMVCFLGFASMAMASAPAIYNKCKVCHGVDGKKVPPGAKKSMNGLSKEQILTLLNGYKAGTANNGGNAKIMYMQMKNVSDQDIAILADYIATLK